MPQDGRDAGRAGAIGDTTEGVHGETLSLAGNQVKGGNGRERAGTAVAFWVVTQPQIVRESI
jgi:hypothetical protein